MKLLKILNTVNQIEKSSFVKTVDSITTDLRADIQEIDVLLSENEGQLKDIGNESLVRLFKHIKDKFFSCVKEKLQYNNFHLDILIDIIIRDGNSIMSRDWLDRLYKAEIEKLRKQVVKIDSILLEENRDLDEIRKRDYQIFYNCVKMAYENDLQWNRQRNITREEQSILIVLAKSLSLSTEERRKIYYSILPLDPVEIDAIIKSLKELGIIFYVKNSQMIYVPDEVIWSLRKLLGVDISDKHYRQILRKLTDVEINRVVKNHSIDKNLDRNGKIKEILKQGVSISNVLLDDIHKLDISKTDIKNYLQNLIENKLRIDLKRIGTTSEERISKLIGYFDSLESDENIGMSIDGFKKMLGDFKDSIMNNDSYANQLIKDYFELQQEDVLNAELFIDYNIKPLDLLYLFSKEELTKFCEGLRIKTRGDIRFNIIENYKNIEDLFIENYELVAKRDLNALAEKGITIKESELGLKFEDITKTLLKKLGFGVDDKLKKKLNTQRAQMDILINLGNNELVIVECKTQKEKNYNKYSAVTRQLHSYEKLCAEKGYKVNQIILVANEFSEEFISECEYEPTLNLSLLTSSGLLQIVNGFNNTEIQEFPTRLLFKGGMLNADRIVSVLNK